MFHTKEEKKPGFSTQFEFVMSGRKECVCDRLISQNSVKNLLHSNKPLVKGYRKETVSWSSQLLSPHFQDFDKVSYSIFLCSAVSKKRLPVTK